MTATIDRSKIGRTSRDRGRRAEAQVANYLRSEGWPDARRYLSGDGQQPGDLDWHPLVCLEVKDTKGSAWPTWCRQAAAEARPGMVPVVTRRTRVGNDVGAWEIRADWCTWVEVFGSPPPFQHEGVEVDGRAWLRSTMADLVVAVRRVDS